MADTVQERINHYWSARASEYDANQTQRQGRPGARAVWAEVWGAVLPVPAADVLDLGTGSGNVALLLAEMGYRVTGIDLAPGMLEQAVGKAEGVENAPRFLLGDAAAPPGPEGHFDALTARYVLWTLRDPDLSLRNWLAQLRPGGVLVAVDSLWYPDGLHAAHGHADATDLDREMTFAYDHAALQRLPLAQATDIQRAGELLQEAGFGSVEITELPKVMALDQRYGVAPGHRVQMQYRITARRP